MFLLNKGRGFGNKSGLFLEIVGIQEGSFMIGFVVGMIRSERQS